VSSQCLENATATARENHRMKRTRSETLKLFVVSDAERRSMLLAFTRSMGRRNTSSKSACWGLNSKESFASADHHCFCNVLDSSGSYDGERRMAEGNVLGDCGWSA
jgi:hypothetical protein